MTAQGNSRRAAAQEVLAALASAGSGLPYDTFFATPGYAPPVLAAAAGGAALATLAAGRGWRVLTTLLTATVGLAALATYILYPDTLRYGLPTVDTLSSLATGLGAGWPRMLSVSLPAGAEGHLVFTPMLLTWTASVTAVTLALRTRAVLAPLAPPVLAFVAGLLLSAGAGGRGPAVAALFLGTLLALVLTRASGPATWTAAGPVTGVLASMAVLASATSAVTALPPAAAGDRFDLRDLLPPTVRPADHLSPLVLIRSQLNEETPRALFTVRAPSGRVPGLIRTAALTRYDGARWTSTDLFLRAGRTLTPDPDLARTSEVTLRIDIQDLPGPYLPAAGLPTSIDLDGTGFNGESGVLVSDARSLEGASFTVTGRLPSAEGLGSAVTDLVADAPFTELPAGLPPLIPATAEELTAPFAGSYDRLTAIEEYLRELPYSINARPGHSLDAVSRLLNPRSGDRSGYAEQHATAFAVLARSLGIPTRIAVGYRVDPSRRVADSYQVTSHDAHAWPEVRFAEYGWVPFEPTDPGNAASPDDRPSPPTLPAGPARPDEAATGGPDRGVGDGSVNADMPLPAHSRWSAPVLGMVIVAAVSAAALLLTAAAAVVLAKARRRRRRRTAAGPAARIIGAWQETADRLIAHGVAVPASATALEVSETAASRLGPAADSVAGLASLLTEAVYCPDDPGTAAAARAWQLEASFAKNLRRTRGRVRALRVRLDPRPLTRRRMGGSE